MWVWVCICSLFGVRERIGIISQNFAFLSQYYSSSSPIFPRSLTTFLPCLWEKANVLAFMINKHTNVLASSPEGI